MPWIPAIPECCPLCGGRELIALRILDGDLPAAERHCIPCKRNVLVHVWWDLSEITAGPEKLPANPTRPAPQTPAYPRLPTPR